MTTKGYGGLDPERVRVRMKKLGMDLRGLMVAFARANNDTRDKRTFENWLSGERDLKSTDLGYLANALSCKPEDILERL